MTQVPSSPTVPVGTGQVFTPEWLSDAMARAAFRHLSATRSVRVCEPSAGAGALLDGVFRVATEMGCRVDAEAWETDPALVAELRGKFGDRVRLHQRDTLHALTEDSPPAPFDVVVANPPWLRESGNREVFRAIRGLHPDLGALYAKDADLHHFFWLAALRWLRPGGVAVMLTPAYVLSTRSATVLRARLLAKGEVVGIWRSGSTRVFPDASVECAVTVWRKYDTDEAPGLDTLTAPVLDSALQGTAGIWQLPADGAAWRTSDADAAPTTAGPTLGDWFRVVEGVSTGANAVRAEHVEALRAWWEDRSTNPLAGHGRMPARGDGIFVLRRADLHVAGLSPGDPRLFSRWQHPEQWILMLRDGDLPRLDAGLLPESAIERHVWRFRPVLTQRAEIQRNASRSWYALTWPRTDAWTGGTIVTPKWSRTPAFRELRNGSVPMTDCRILVPRTDAARLLGSDLVGAWNAMSPAELASHLAQKGAMLEFYGDGLARLPIPKMQR
jgi:hypothetical protein